MFKLLYYIKAMRVPNYGELSPFLMDGGEYLDLLNKEVRFEFAHLVTSGHIVGAFPFGSTQFNDANQLSDYDMVVAVDDNGVDAETESFRAIHDVTKRLQHTYGIPFEISCYTIDQLTEGLHGFPDVMLSWLKSQAFANESKYIGEPFIDSIRTKRIGASPDSLRDLDDYVDRTRYVLKKNWLQGVGARSQDVLGAVLSVPHVVGRKAIDTMQQSHTIGVVELKDLTKSSINESVLSTFSDDSKLVRLYSEIVGDRQKFLDEFIPEAHKLSIDEYELIIDAVLEDNLPKCIELLRRIQEEYRRMYNESHGLGRARTYPYVERGSNLTYDELQSQMVMQVRMQQLESM